jgi:hypothetical protein
MSVSADILQKQHYLAGSDKAGYHPVSRERAGRVAWS